MASQRDVPGVTRGIVPLLRSKGVLAFSEGANGAFTSPQVPLLFNWSDAASGSSIVYLNHPSGYGLQAEDGMGLSLTDSVTLKGFDQALIFVSARALSDTSCPEPHCLTETVAADRLFVATMAGRRMRSRRRPTSRARSSSSRTQRLLARRSTILFQLSTGTRTGRRHCRS